MAQSKQVFTETFKIRSSEVRPDGKTKLQTICDLLQESAGNHALRLNFDITQLNEKSLTWFLQRLDVRVRRYPEWREEVTVRTWPSRGDQLRAYRDFEVLDSTGEPVVLALSYWLMIDTKTRRPVRMPEEVLDLGPVDVEHVVPLKKTRPAPPENPGTDKIFSVRQSDLDVNRHVNNVSYIEWIVETIPAGTLVGSIDIEFQAECAYGDDIIVSSSSNGEGLMGLTIVLRGGDKLLATAEVQI